MNRDTEPLNGWQLAAFWLGLIAASACLMTALAAGVGALLASFLL